ncbi:hypothetical protein M409DRAFT_21790 [Zasmidium cellare ATCC 36951]|uniref:Uncharacterized protein n=1 Tax=Zasmidium cellare ATCC 36951 TaxID=1080233 RepID=A0A6A6CM05_ZASCE|nr:uncharacterized protein M409DRAFT_21790 [Zasmidium cellare ATCC 36951]KAF2167633.1 hypothetical protein M409DRAFT_21790 [Zasmidium cellare ATCC 36951]
MHTSMTNTLKLKPFPAGRQRTLGQTGAQQTEEELDSAGQDLLDTQGDVSTPSDESHDSGQSILDLDHDGTELEDGRGDQIRFTIVRAATPQSPGHEHENYREHANMLCEWSGEVNELPRIDESDAQTDEGDEEPSTSSNTLKIEPKRRSSETYARTLASGRAYGMRRISSMSEMLRLKGRLRVPALLSPKAAPACPAITACSIRIFEPPRLNTVYESPSEFEGKQTAHTVQSDHGTVRMVWEEPANSASSSVATVLVDDSVGVAPADDIEDHVVPPSPRMERVKTKLTVWSWEREFGDESDDRPPWSPLIDLSDERCRVVNRQSDHSPLSEAPLAPPNTARQSGQSSAKQSEPQSPAPELSDDSTEESPIELRIRPKSQTALPTRSNTPENLFLAPPRRSSLPASPSIARNLSSLGTDDIRFRSHRDSVEITHGHIKRHEEEGPINQELLNSRDSFDLTKSKMAARYPRAPTPTIHRSRLVVMRPIADASPPTSMARLRPQPDEEERHPDEHDNCPICEEHRPRWFESKHRTW